MMILFWVVALLLVGAALLFLLPPLWQQKSADERLRRRQINISIHRDKLAELEQDLARGVLSQEQYAAAKKEIEVGLLEDVGDDQPEAAAVDASRQQNFSRNGVIAVAVLLPLAAVALYGKLGGGAAAFKPDEAVAGVSADGHDNPIEGMVNNLVQKLKANPDDAEGWMMLGRSYYFMKKHQEAAGAFTRALSLVGENDPNLLADLADTLAMANNRSMAGRPFELVKKALTLEPNHEKSLWLAGTAAYQMGDLGSAYQYWDHLQHLFPPESDSAQQIANNLDELRGMMTERGIAPPAPSTAPTAASKPAGSAGISGSSVSGRVTLAAALNGGAAPDDTLFVFARAANGPRMPLAILRKKVKDLPLDFELNDGMAMNPQMKLSAFPEVVVGARVSKSGNAMPQSGDLEGLSPVVSVGTTQIPVTINTVVP